MQKYLSPLVLLLFIPLISSAAFFERDLYFGIRNSADVIKLQEFLRDEGLYDGPVTGNFLVLTREAIKNFQRREKIEPALGYFGPKTRARAKEILEKGKSSTGSDSNILVPERSEAKLKGLPSPTQDLIASLTAQIQALQARLQELRQQASSTAQPVSEPSPSAASVSTPVFVSAPASATSSASIPTSTPAVLEIKGNAQTPFPEIATTPLKLGDITVSNHTSSGVELLQFIVDITDDMNSQLNRGRGVFFLIRSGTTTFDTAISKTPFTFLSKDPRGEPVGPNVSRLNLPYNAALKPGEERVISLWIENLDLVLNGTLAVELKEVLTSETVSTAGNFKFTLTK